MAGDTGDGGGDTDVVADLHVHTTASDGQLTVPDIPAAARDAGVECVAVTDHDRLNPDLDAPVTRRDGVTLIRGIELRVETGDQRVDLLGYAAEATDALQSEIERIQRDRVERGRRIIDCVESRLGVDLDLESHEGLGRPHIARAIAASDADYGYGEAFDRLIGDDCPCYVARDVPSFERGVSLLSEACALVSLAHPFRYPDPEAALALTTELDAVERYYPYEHDVAASELAALDAQIEREGLLVTGGTDAHATELGLAGVGRADFEAIASALPGAQG